MGFGNGLAACARIQFSGRSLWAARTLPGHYVKMQQFCNDFTLLLRHDEKRFSIW